jgi:signal transduction histidine kinase
LQRAVRSAVEETGRLGQLADDLLLLTRADEHHLAIKTAPVAVRGLLDAAAARARRRWPSSKVRIAVDAPDDAVVVADSGRVGQALDNLLANAMRYATSEISLTSASRDGTVEVHVRDDGPGFPQEFLPDAWTRFARADVARTEDGAGLGLAIVQTIAELHGATAHATNRSPSGADVWIVLPRPRATGCNGTYVHDRHAIADALDQVDLA